MRQIKLRIKLKNKHDGKEITLYNDVFDAMNGIAFYNIDRTDWEFISADDYTGFKDRNGKEIYNGDRLFICQGYTSTVEFKDGMFVSVYKHPEDGEIIPLVDVIGRDTLILE